MSLPVDRRNPAPAANTNNVSTTAPRPPPAPPPAPPAPPPEEKKSRSLWDRVKEGAGNVAGRADEFVRDRANEVRNVVTDVTGKVEDVRDFVGDAAGEVKDRATDVAGDVKDAVVNTAEKFQDILQPPSVNDVKRMLGLDGDQVARDRLVRDTQDLRATGTRIESLQNELSGLPKGSPRYNEATRELAQSRAHLKDNYGYTEPPKPGSLWVDPQFLSDQLVNGKVTAENFPVQAADNTPPTTQEVLFGSGGPLKLVDASGAERSFDTMEAYQAFVAETRAATGMPRTDGEVQAVHMSMEGGGGKGKRYGAALSEMYAQGVVPTSFSGSSAGAIAASMAAAGADPVEMQRIVTDPQLQKLYDVDLKPPDGGLMNGNAAFDFIDKQLAELTGIHDRPVTFADLKSPLYLTAVKMSDSQWPPGADPTKVEDRMFIFSKETTPDTPVSLAVRASMAIPAAFDPVQMVDPMTGRKMTLVDGGTLDNLPMGYQKNDLPVIGMTLGEQASNHPSKVGGQPKPLPSGNIDAGNLINNARYGYQMSKDGAGGSDDFRDRTQPGPGEFMLSLPTWNLQNPDQKNSTLGFGWDPKVDPVLDSQGREVTRNFLREYLDDLGQPGASGTNTPFTDPKDLSFTQDVHWRGKDYVATYTGGDKVSFVEKNGNHRFSANIDQKKVESLYIDAQSFGHFGPALAQAVDDQMGFFDKVRRGKLPFSLPF